MAKKTEQQLADQVKTKGGKIADDLEAGRITPGKAWRETSEVVLDALREQASD